MAEVTVVAMAAGTVGATELAARISAVAGITLVDIAAASRAIRSDAHTSAAADLPRGTRTLAPCATPQLRRAMRAMP
jgi:hypothetical protein